MERTWDLPPQAYKFGALRACPTLAADIANTALRGGIDLSASIRGREDLSRLNQYFSSLGSNDTFPSSEAIYSFADTELASSIDVSPEAYQYVSEEGVRQALIRRVTVFNRLTRNDDSVEPLILGNQNLVADRESLRQALANVMLNPDSRVNFFYNVTRETERKDAETRQRLANGNISYDVVVRGAGYHTANFLATLQETCPDAKVLIIDDGSADELGGQFHRYGERPSFFMNSLLRPVSNIYDVYGIARNNGNLNTLGLHAPFQMPDFVGTEKPTNIDAAHAAAAVIALADPDILLTKNAQDILTSDPTTQTISVPPFLGLIRIPCDPNNYIFGGGLGTPNQGNASNNEKSIAAMYKEYGSYGSYDTHPGLQYAGKILVYYGCGDSAKSGIQLTLKQGPPEAYEGLPMQQGLPERIYWIAEALADLGTRKRFKDGTRGIYSGLSRFFPVNEGGRSLIVPIAGRVVNNIGGRITYIEKGQTSTKDLYTEYNVVPDIIMPAPGLIDPNAGNADINYVRESRPSRDRLRSPVAPSISGRFDDINASTIGTIGMVPARSNAGVPENSSAIFLYAPAATIAGYNAGLRVQQQRRQRARQSYYT
jgi:hypothetical protein